MLVRIVSDSISFGCMKGKRYGDGKLIYIILYDKIDAAYTTFVPVKNDLIWCKYHDAHVFRPIARINESHLCVRMLNIPNDILCHYFPLVSS